MNLAERLAKLEVIPNSLGIYFLGQVGVALRGPDGLILIDPYLTDSDGHGGHLPRLYPPPIQPHKLRGVTAVLISHNHADHFDPETLKPIVQNNPNVRMFGPHNCDFMGLGLRENQVGYPDPLEPFYLGSAEVCVVPSAHYGLEPTPQGFTYYGFLLEWNGVQLYHAGDTIVWMGDHPELADLPPTDRLHEGLIELVKSFRPDVAFLPINGRDHFRETDKGMTGNLDVRESAELAELWDVDVVIPTHFDLFAANPEDPGRFVDYLRRLNPNRTCRVMRPGELLYYFKE
jgi:L-ascorbate 6-phosphate lactonase